MYLGTLLLYLAVSVITAVLAWYSTKTGNLGKRWIRGAIAVFIPSVFAACRVGIGTDYYYTYYPYFNHLAYGGWFWSTVRMETGYELINQIVIRLGGNFQTVLFIMAVITVSSVIKCLRDFEAVIHPGVAMLIFMLQYYFVSFNWTRQICAAAITLCALKPIRDKDWKRMLAYTVPAVLIHRTAVLAIGFYFLINIYKNRKHKLIGSLLYAGAFSVILFIDRIYEILLARGSYYAHYLQPKAVTGNFTGVLARRGTVILLLWLQRKEIRKSPIMIGLFHMFCIGSIIELLTYVTSFQSERIAAYFRMPCMLLIGYLGMNVIDRWRIKKSKLPELALILFVAIEFYYELFFRGYHEVVPYSWVFGA